MDHHKRLRGGVHLWKNTSAAINREPAETGTDGTSKRVNRALSHIITNFELVKETGFTNPCTAVESILITIDYTRSDPEHNGETNNKPNQASINRARSLPPLLQKQPNHKKVPRTIPRI